MSQTDAASSQTAQHVALQPQGAVTGGQEGGRMTPGTQDYQLDTGHPGSQRETLDLPGSSALVSGSTL